MTRRSVRAWLLPFAGAAFCASERVCAQEGYAETKLSYSGLAPGSYLGAMVALGDGLLAARTSTAVVVYRDTGTEWLEETSLIGAGVATTDGFGVSIAIEGPRIVVGAPFHSGTGGTSAGAVWVFHHDGVQWIEEQKIEADDAIPNARLGRTVAISGDRLLTGAEAAGGDAGPGRAYVYRRDGDQWLLEQSFSAADSVPGDKFGYSLSLADGRCAIGAYAPGGIGAAYVFEHDGVAWIEQQKLVSSDPEPSDLFGKSLALDGDYLVISANRHDHLGLDAGAAYVFHLVGGRWSEVAELLPTYGGPNARFGTSVHLRGAELVVGAREHLVQGVDSGAAYHYRYDGQTWNEAQQLSATSGGSFDFFGHGVAVDGDTVAVGANLHDQQGLTDSGAVFLYSLVPATLPVFYCVSKASSAGCVATIATSAKVALPVSGAGDYAVTAGGVHELKVGLLVGSLAGQANLPFNGGTLCVQPPTKRGPIVTSGGGSALGCEGTFATLVNDGLVPPFGLDAGPGNAAWYQYWYRDPANGIGLLGTALSNAVRLDFE